MTNEDCEKIAELVFQKMVALQNEWDAQHSVQEIVRLTVLKAGYIDSEEYLKAAEVQKQIDNLKNSINKS
jgi:protein-arginine kinase activator protein McsA